MSTLYPMLAAVLGWGEAIVIVLVVLLLFGATRLPKLARSVGKAGKELRRGYEEGITEDEEV